jgi:type I restriction enzyme M protein
VDVILTNPPFGGEEEVGIKANFPPNMQTAETALLFLQYIMRKLRVAGAPVPGGKPTARGGRAAVVVPNGTLFGDGISAVIKEEMLKEFQTPHHRAPAARCVRALHRHSGQPAVL